MWDLLRGQRDSEKRCCLKPPPRSSLRRMGHEGLGIKKLWAVLLGLRAVSNWKMYSQGQNSQRRELCSVDGLAAVLKNFLLSYERAVLNV